MPKSLQPPNLRRPRARLVRRAVLGLALALTATSAAASRSDAPVPAGVAPWIEGFRRPAAIPAPADNPLTEAKAELGKALFFDPRLSASGSMSCASCHNPALGWQDARMRAAGSNGQLLPRHTPTILDIAWSEPLFWDGRAGTLEEQARFPITGAREMNMRAEDAVAMVQGMPGYRTAFATAFPGQPISFDAIARAIASYERTIVSAPAPFDRWIEGDGNAISASAQRGFVLFNTRAGCAACHSGWRFTDDGFHDIGLPGDDMGRAAIAPGLEILERAFKTPTLRNIAERGPYMHDGSIATLAAVLDHYDTGFLGRTSLSPEMKRLGLSAPEKADLLAFLRSLSSPNPPVTIPFLYR